MKSIQSLVILVLLAVFVNEAKGQNVSQWRGVNRDGIYPDKNLLKTWPENGPKLLWSTEQIGCGFGSPVIAGDRLFINGEIDSISHVFAFDIKGNLIWKTPNGREFFGKGFSASFPGARSTPTVYNGLVYACSGQGRIACLDATSGKELWAVDMIGGLGGKLNMFGCSESLFVDDKNVYCYPGGKESNVVALDRLTGKVVWTSKALGDAVSFCSPMSIKFAKKNEVHRVRNVSSGEFMEKTIAVPERNILVTLSHDYLLGMDMKNGEALWSYKQDSTKLEGAHCNTPICSDGFIYNVSGDDKGNGAYKLELSADGKSIKEIWRNGKVLNAIGGFVKIDQKLYTTSKDNKLKCLDANTGMVIDSVSGLRGSIIYADDHLYCYSDNGNMCLVNIAGPKMQVVSKFKIDKGAKEHFAHPVISNGVLYVRHGKALMAYGIK